MSDTNEPERIWLQAAADADPGIGRQWCEHKVWPDSVDDSEPTEYVRADLCRAGQSASDERVAELEAALRDQLNGCSMLVTLLKGQESRVAASLISMLNAQINLAFAALGEKP